MTATTGEKLRLLLHQYDIRAELDGDRIVLTGRVHLLARDEWDHENE